jgi:hypothetical protein
MARRRMGLDAIARSRCVFIRPLPCGVLASCSASTLLARLIQSSTSSSQLSLTETSAAASALLRASSALRL